MVGALALIVYGNGLQALYYDERNPYSNRNGVKVQQILVAPSEEIISKYKLTNNDLNMLTDDNKKAMWIEYPVKQIRWINRSISGALIFIWCAFDGAETPIMGTTNELLEWDKQRDITESRLRAQISTLQRELENVTSNEAELMRQIKELQDIQSAKQEQSTEEEMV